ncbi:lytic transglycosylase domain-containing protein [Pseudomonas gingeri]|uniref:lytic transglycosylase domain-containing protein n=1 Tax=Pseudomonas gingeri TaxID=117681 RepID=UPI003CCCBDF5
MAAAMNPGRLVLLGALAGGCLLALPVTATSLPPLAYRWATQGTPVPPQVLYALALQESGASLRGRLRPWPWTLNVAGLPYRYADRQSACHALLRAIGQVGAKRVDAGLGQINLGWNGEHFAHPCEALDPYRNLSVATALLLEHKTAEIDWVTAAGRYHRPAGGAPAERYRKTFARHLARVTLGAVQGRYTP